MSSFDFSNLPVRSEEFAAQVSAAVTSLTSFSELSRNDWLDHCGSKLGLGTKFILSGCFRRHPFVVAHNQNLFLGLNPCSIVMKMAVLSIHFSRFHHELLPNVSFMCAHQCEDFCRVARKYDWLATEFWMFNPTACEIRPLRMGCAVIQRNDIGGEARPLSMLMGDNGLCWSPDSQAPEEERDKSWSMLVKVILGRAGIHDSDPIRLHLEFIKPPKPEVQF